jgi:hypothetical protein
MKRMKMIEEKMKKKEKKEKKNNWNRDNKWKYREGRGRMVRKEDRGESECNGSI